jgi:MarR family transcriptional regulator, transcriptional regulator for hemolysin
MAVSTRWQPFGDPRTDAWNEIERPDNAADLAERFENALHNAARGWRHAMDRRLKYFGISAAGWMTIAAASEARSPLSQSELADMLSVSRASMVHMIDHLVKAGLVVREPSISDRRVNRIVVTDAGHRVYAESKKLATAVRQQLIAGIHLEKLMRLTELLEQLQCILQAYPDRAPVTLNYHETLDWV